MTLIFSRNFFYKFWRVIYCKCKEWGMAIFKFAVISIILPFDHFDTRNSVPSYKKQILKYKHLTITTFIWYMRMTTFFREAISLIKERVSSFYIFSRFSGSKPKLSKCGIASIAVFSLGFTFWGVTKKKFPL